MKGGERRAAIVRSAILLFAEKGFRGTTTRELAASLGVTEPVLYQHFPTKHALYSAIIEAKATEVSEQTGAIRQLAQSGDDRAFFTALGDLILRRYETDPPMLRILFFSALERHELADLFFERLFVDFYKLVAGYIRRRVRAGAFRCVHPETAARGFIGMMTYHGLINILFPKRIRQPNRKRIVREMVTMFLNGIEVQRPEEPNPPAPRRDSASSPSTHSTAS
jgi:AcrR family transcriptional regulator